MELLKKQRRLLEGYLYRVDQNRHIFSSDARQSLLSPSPLYL